MFNSKVILEGTSVFLSLDNLNSHLRFHFKMKLQLKHSEYVTTG